MTRRWHQPFPINPWIVVVFIAMLGVIVSVQGLIPYLVAGRSFDGYAVLAPSLIAFLLWLLASPLINDLAHYMVSMDRSLAWRMSVGLVVFAILSFVHSAVSLWLFSLRYTLFEQMSLNLDFHALLGMNLLQSALELVMLLGLLVSAVLFRRAQRQATDLIMRERDLANAKTEALTLQLQPHFLFNALHSVSGLIDGEPDKAHAMLEKTGNFLRTILTSTKQSHGTLADEVTHLRNYVSMVRERVGQTFQVHFAVPNELNDCMLPSLILQPLVENAFKYGTDGNGGKIEIGAGMDGERLHLWVEDEGCSHQSPVLPSTGVGLANTQARLRALYGSDYFFEAQETTDAGFRVDLKIPFRRSSS